VLGSEKSPGNPEFSASLRTLCHSRSWDDGFVQLVGNPEMIWLTADPFRAARNSVRPQGAATLRAENNPLSVYGAAEGVTA